jgi:hypothetical protein
LQDNTQLVRTPRVFWDVSCPDVVAAFVGCPDFAGLDASVIGCVVDKVRFSLIHEEQFIGLVKMMVYVGFRYSFTFYLFYFTILVILLRSNYAII